MQRSGSHVKIVKSAFLIIIMIIMTQVGYLDLINSPRTGNDSFDEESPVMETGGSGSSFAYSNNKMSAGGYHTCAILDNGDMKCWGYDSNGQLGDGGSNTNTDAPSSTAIDLGTGRTAVAVSGATYHTCAVLDNGDVKCWGRDNHGQLGDGGSNTNTDAPSSTAIDLDLGTGRAAVAVHAGFSHTCAILDNGDMKCWGRDNYGQLGNGAGVVDTNAPSFTPIDLGTGRTAVAASVGEYHTCAILDNGDMKCWGSNSNGQLGNGGAGSVTAVQSPPSTPIDLGTGRTAVALSVGDKHTCAILDNGDMKCWGYDSNGQLGDGGTNTGTNAPSSTAIDLGTGRTAVAITGGGFHTCAILDNGDVKCWGYDNFGQLGDGGTNTDIDTPSSTPIDLGTGRTAVAISAGQYHTCATLDNGDMKCWGYDWAGQLGDGGSNTNQGSPAPILGTDNWDSSTGLSTPSYTLTPSVEGADLTVGEAMEDITFQYNSSATSGSGSGSNSGTYNGNGTAWMVRDINTGTSNNGGSMSVLYLEQDAVMGNEMYFFATDSTNGYELWKSDGTESGTVMVKDINNGSGSSMPFSNSALSVNSNLHLKAMNNTNTLFFVANDGIHGEELWKTDGTASGTVMVKDINSANGNSGHSEIGEFTQMGSTLYFRADDGTNGQELWKTDGTSSGTVMVKDINPGNAGVVDCDCLRAITVVGNTLYFTADDGTHGEELWKSDGTTAGTVMVKNIGTGGLGAEGSGIEHISVAGNYIYFAAKPTLSVTSLFRSDGTAAGTVVIKPNDFIWTKPTITIGSTLFFVGGSTYNATIWKSNGTSSSTTMAVDVLPQTNTLHTLGADTYGIGGKRCDRNVGNSFYFMARDHAAGGGLDTRYLWKTDGTASGTVQVKDVNNANVTGGWSTCGIIGDTLFFVKEQTRQLWKTNGTPSGTKMIIDMDSLSPSGYGELYWNFASINNKLYFGASDGTNGTELWALDPANITGLGGGSGSSGGMTNVTGATCSVSPALPTGLNIDSSTCTISGTPSVATSNTTYTITAVISGTTFQTSVWLSSSNPILTPSVEGADLFIGEAMTPITFSHSYQIPQGYVTSGNNSTWYLQPTASSQASVLPCDQPNMVEMGDYYLAECEEDLSILDFDAGTRTTLVANAWPYTNQNNPRLLWSVEADGTRYYMLQNGSMYEYDEVARDLVYITSIQSLGAQGMQFISSTNTCFDCLPVLNDEFYFHLKAFGGQNQIWKSDGTASGTVPVANISSTSMVGDDYLPFVYNGEIYYSDFASGTSTLSASDGTVSGTRIVHQDNALKPLVTSMSYGTTFNGEYYYLQQSGIVKTDGTAAGTTFIADCPDLYMSNPRPELFVFDQNLYWIGECLGNTGTGNELYKFDGTSASLVANFVPDSSTNSVDGLAWNAGSVNFKVWNETHFAFDGGVANCHPNNCEMDDLYISDGTSSGTVVIMDGHLYAHEFSEKSSIIGSVVYHSSYRSHGTEWCYTDLTGVRANPINGSSAPAEVCFGIASGGIQAHHGYAASFNIDDTLVILMRPANGNHGNYAAGFQYYSYSPNNITISTSPPVIWSTDPALPSGIGISNGVISGTPTVATSNTTYTVTATIGSVTLQTDIWLSSSNFGEITSTVDGAELQLGEAMTPISLNYNSQAGTATVVNGSGNQTRWTISEEATNSPYHVVEACGSGSQTAYIPPGQMLGLTSQYGSCSGLIGDTIYFKGRSNASSASVPYSLWAFRPANDSVWAVTPHLPSVNSPHIQIVDERIYFTAVPLGGTRDLYVHDTTNGSTWMAYDLEANVNQWSVFDDYLVIAEWGGASGNILNLHTFSTNQTWEIPGKGSWQGSDGYKSPYNQFHKAGDQILWQGEAYVTTNSGNKVATGADLCVYTLSNNSTFCIDVSPVTSGSTVYSINPHYFHTIGSKTYFLACDTAYGYSSAIHSMACGTSNNAIKNALWVYDPSNTSIWRLTPAGEQMQGHWIGDQHWELKANPSNSNLIGLRIFDSTNNSIWWETNGIALSSNNNQYYNLATNTLPMVHAWAGTRAYFTAMTSGNLHSVQHKTHMWAYEASNNSAWEFVDGGYASDPYAIPAVNPSSPFSCSGQFGTKEHVFIGTELFYITAHDDNCGGWISKEPHGEVTFSNPPPTTWETEPPLPAGMSISGGTISGTPSVYASNQTYTIYANQSGQTTTHDLYFSVDNAYPHTVVEDQPIDAIGFHPAFWDGTTAWSISPSLPNTLLQDSATGEITGTVDSPMSDTFTVTATHSSGATETFTFSLESLLDTDGDGLANDLPPTYNPANPPTPGLIADDDDDGDGLLDSVETDTGLYINGQDAGTDPLDPDTDDDGICDGPNAVPPICIAGPDPSPNGNTPPPILVGVNNTDIGTVSPYLVVPGGTFEISPDLPNSLSIDPNTGEITGTPTQTLDNTTFTVWSNHTDGTWVSWDFTIEILEDSDGDGMPNELPDDYDPTNPDSPGLIEDLDDDNDGNSDVDEATDGTDPTNPDTDGDGMCDGPVGFEPDCVAGPDAFPLDPSADTDTDGDGDPDTLNPPSTSVPPLVEDLDDDGDGVDDVNETNTGIYNGDTDTGTNPLDPDTDNDGICDGPIDVLPICVAGPDTELGTAIDGTAYLLNNTPMTYLMPKYDVANAVYEVHPELPAGIVIDPVTGVISGTPTEVTDNVTYTLFANVSADGFESSWSFNMQVLEDTDGDGLPNELPDDYPTTGEAPFDLVEDLDDDGDGALDTAETGTGIFNGSADMGTDPLDPDTDDDGICDGPNDVLPVCIAGPDSNPIGTGPLGPTVLVNNTEMIPLPPANAVPGAIWAVSPDLPAGLTLNVATGVISGTPLETMDNTTFTLWANTSEPRSVESTFWLQVLEDTDGDGLPDQLPDDYPDTGLPPFDLIEDLDDDADGMPDVDEATNGTDSLNPDTDGDGFCDGPSAVDGICYAGPDSHPLDPDMPVNTDGDAFPDDDPDGEGGLIADDDDDNDGYLDTLENDCLSDPLNATDVPSDMDGDGICDALDDDMDGDGVLNDEETNTGNFDNQIDGQTDPANPDSDGDGICDGPATPDANICVAGPDAFPNDPAAAVDTDGDGMPDDLLGESTTGLIEDDDDDNDLINDVTEAECLTDPKVVNALPDIDGDGICDAMDDIVDLPFEMSYDSQHLDLFVNKSMDAFMPNVTGLGDVASWELIGELPEGLTFGVSEARSAGLDGGIRGIPANATEEPLNLTIWANNSNYQQSFSLMLTVFNDTDNDSLPDSLPLNYTGNLTADDDDDNDGFFDQDEINCGSDPLDTDSNPTNTAGNVCEKLADGGKDDEKDGLAWWCFPFCFLLLLLLLVPLLLFRDRVIGVIDDAEPEHTTSKPKFVEGAGTKENPFILKPAKTVKPGDTIYSKEVITITNITPNLKVKSVDFFDRENGRKFTMQDQAGSDEGVRMIEANEDGEIKFKLIFDDSFEPTLAGGEFQGAVKVGRRSVYLMWDVKVKPDPDYIKEQKKLEAERKKAEKAAEKQSKKEAAEAEKQAALKAKEAEEKAKMEADKAEKQAKKEAAAAAKEEAAAAKEAEAAALAAAAAAEAEAAELKAKKAADAAEKKAKKAAEAKAKKEAAAEKKAKKEADDAEKKAKADAKAEADKAAAAEAEAKAKKEADEADKQAKADAKAEADKAKKAAAKKPATTKQAKKEEEIKRVKSRAKSIDFKVLGTASSTKLKSEVKKGAKALEVADAKEFADAGSAAITDDAGSTMITWTGKDGNTLTGVGGITRVFGKASVVMVRDDLQVIKGIGPFIEEKLNALGITTYRQIANMTAKLETQVNEAIEFFPGRVKRDQWVNQAKILLGEDVKLDEKALKQAEELERIAQKAETIDFATLGVATIDEKDDLQTIKGIGPFIAEKLYALGIYTFEQVGNMTPKIEEEVNKAIEFFPGRVKRDEWAKQAKELHEDKK